MASSTKYFPVFLLLVACGEERGNDSADPCDAELYSYHTVGKPYLTSWCVPCHSPDLEEGLPRADAPVGVDFDSYEALIEQLEKIPAWALGVDPLMPPAGGPTADELALFTHWIECGAQE